MQRLSQYTLTELKELFNFGSMSSTKIKSILNIGQQKVADLVNQKTTRRDYIYDFTADANLVLAPTPSSIENQYDGYMQIKFGADSGSGASITEVNATLIGFTLENSSIDYSGTYVIYTITVSGETITGDTRIEPSIPSEQGISDRTATSFKVTVDKLHSAFSIFLLKAKES